MQLHSDVSERTVFANYKQTVHLYTKRIAHSHRLLYYCCVNRRSRSIGYASLKLNFGVKNHPQLSSILFAINSIELQLFRSKAIPALRVQQRKKWKMNRVGKRQLNASGSLSTLLCRCVFFFSSFLLRSSNRILFTAQADAKMDTVLCTCTRKQWGSDDDGKRECTIAQSQMRCNKIKWHQKCINSSGAAANIALNVCMFNTDNNDVNRWKEILKSAMGSSSSVGRLVVAETVVRQRSSAAAARQRRWRWRPCQKQ